jgi:hypothetical protein
MSITTPGTSSEKKDYSMKDDYCNQKDEDYDMMARRRRPQKSKFFGFFSPAAAANNLSIYFMTLS